MVLQFGCGCHDVQTQYDISLRKWHGLICLHSEDAFLNGLLHTEIGNADLNALLNPTKILEALTMIGLQ